MFSNEKKQDESDQRRKLKILVSQMKGGSYYLSGACFAKQIVYREYFYSSKYIYHFSLPSTIQ